MLLTGKILLLVVIVIALIAIPRYRDAHRKVARELAFYVKNFQWRQVTNENKITNLYSFDNGTSWVVVDSSGNIIGKLDNVFPDTHRDIIAASKPVEYEPTGWMERHFRLPLDRATAHWYSSRYDSKNGGGTLSGVGNYRLVSYDRGKHWVALKPKSREVLGDVNKVYPELLGRLSAMNELTAHVKTHGPINGSDPRGIELLTKVGFTVTHK